MAGVNVRWLVDSIHVVLRGLAEKEEECKGEKTEIVLRPLAHTKSETERIFFVKVDRDSV